MRLHIPFVFSVSCHSKENDEKKKKKRSAPKLKKVIELETKVIITKVQRQKRKYVTVVAGLETVPNLKIKDASKAFGKKFSSGASINESASGVKEVVIQGDVMFDLPPLLVSQFNVWTLLAPILYSHVLFS
jgi:density-regulated protein